MCVMVFYGYKTSETLLGIETHDHQSAASFKDFCYKTSETLLGIETHHHRRVMGQLP